MLLWLVFAILPIVAVAEIDEKSIEITSTQLEIDENKNIFTYIDDVTVVSTGDNVTCDKMIVHYLPKSQQKKSQEISHIEFFNNVHYYNQDEHAYGNYGVYKSKTKVLTLNGDVKLQKPGSLLVGDHLIYNKNTGLAKIYMNQQSRKVKVLYKEVEEDERK